MADSGNDLSGLSQLAAFSARVPSAVTRDRRDCETCLAFHMCFTFFVADVLALTKILLGLFSDRFLVGRCVLEHVSGLVQSILLQIPVLLPLLIIFCDVVATRLDFLKVCLNCLELCFCLFQLLLGLSPSLLGLSKRQLFLCQGLLQGCLLFFRSVIESSNSCCASCSSV